MRKSLLPENGGCWFCFENECDKYFFSFNTCVHLSCLNNILKNGTNKINKASTNTEKEFYKQQLKDAIDMNNRLVDIPKNIFSGLLDNC